MRGVDNSRACLAALFDFIKLSVAWNGADQARYGGDACNAIDGKFKSRKEARV